MSSSASRRGRKRRVNSRRTPGTTSGSSTAGSTAGGDTSQTPVDVDVLEIGGRLTSCIDLTCEDDADIVDLTSVNDSPVVIIGSVSDSPPARRSRRSRGRRRTIPRATGAEDSDNDDEEEEEVLSEDSDLPSYDIPGTPSQSNASEVFSPTRTISCPVCMDNDSQIRANNRRLMSTTCGHVFCDVCIKESIASQRSCPTCRKKLSVKQIHPLFI